MRIALIAGKDTSTCFRLAGLRNVYSATNAEEAEKQFNNLLVESDLAIVLVAEGFVDKIRSIDAKIGERRYPLVVPIPDLTGPVTLKTDFIVELVRSKTGIEIKL
jgi:vacuolar-type H+-ATPase subunit F/Vma7